MYASGHDKITFADQFSWKNIEEIRTGVSEKLGKKWTLTQIFNDLWLATKNDAVYGDGGGIAVAAKPNATSRHIGTELDFIAEYKENRHVSYGFGLAHLFAGQFLNEATPGKDFQLSLCLHDLHFLMDFGFGVKSAREQVRLRSEKEILWTILTVKKQN